MNNVIPAINLISCLFAFGGVYLIVTKQVKPTTFDGRFIIAGGIVLFTLALFNFLEHSGLAESPDIGENFLVIVVFPLLIFAVYSSAVQEEFRRRKRQSEKVEKSNQLLTSIFDNIPVLMMLYDTQTKKATLNKHHQKILGWSNEEINKLDILTTFLKDPLELKKASDLVAQNNGSWNDYNVTTKSGSQRYQSWSLINHAGKVNIAIGVDKSELKLTEQALKKERKRFELISKSTNDVLYEWDLTSDNAWWSRGWETQFGFILESIGTNFEWIKTVIHPDDFEKLNTRFEEVKNSVHHHWFHEYRIINPMGEIIHVLDKGYFIRDDYGEAINLVGAMVNITKEKTTLKRIQESEEKYRLLFNNSPLPKVIYDNNTFQIIEANQAAIELYGYTVDELSGLTVIDVHAEEELDRLRENIEKFRGKFSPVKEWKHKKKNGEIIIAEVTATQINYFGNEYRLALIKDITAERKAEEKVFSSFVEGENRERSRLARELHDGIVQYLAAAGMNFDAIKEVIKNLPKSQQEHFNDGTNYVKQAMTETRSISHNLMPRVVEDYRLSVALETLIDGFEKSSDIQFSYYQNTNNSKFEPKLEINLYRIVQECLTNIIKHSQASQVSVQLIKDEMDLTLTIEDDGIGFNIADEDFKAGIGLNSIKTRAFVIGGTFHIETKTNKGTLIHITVPI